VRHVGGLPWGTVVLCVDLMTRAPGEHTLCKLSSLLWFICGWYLCMVVCVCYIRLGGPFKGSVW
jgi:hypothetical protein